MFNLKQFSGQCKRKAKRVRWKKRVKPIEPPIESPTEVTIKRLLEQTSIALTLAVGENCPFLSSAEISEKAQQYWEYAEQVMVAKRREQQGVEL